jgi:hypothetical protein
MVGYFSVGKGDEEKRCGRRPELAYLVKFRLRNHADTAVILDRRWHVSMFASGHWRPGRARGKSADFRNAAESGIELSYRNATGLTPDDGDFSPGRRQACLSTAIQKARDRQRIGTGAAPRLQPDLHRQARSQRRDPVASRRLPARPGPGCPTGATSGASGSNRRAKADGSAGCRVTAARQVAGARLTRRFIARSWT